jgi:amidophosphoribosyltransferase
MCGIIGIKNKNVSYSIYRGLNVIQHRGQDSCGIITEKNGKYYMKKDQGLVSQVFDERDLIDLAGDVGLGHVRYPTVGSDPRKNAQPFFTLDPQIAIVHNGNIANYYELKNELKKHGRKIETGCDVEVILHCLAEELKKTKDLEESVYNVMERVKGSFSCLALVNGTLVAFRDPYAIRPFVYGENGTYAFASESSALNLMGYELKRDLKPGELMVVDETLEHKIINKKERRHCMFEYVYFSRPDSVIEGKTVYDIRLNLGKTIDFDKDADMVIPVPDTARPAALAFAEKNGIEYKEGLIKNRYTGRTFIMPTQKKREKAVKRNLNCIKSVIKGKKVVLVDDSIVRGTTSRRIVNMVRKAGAKEVHFVSSCPKLLYPCFYGIDFPSNEELIARKDYEKLIGADSVTYQTIEGLRKAIGIKGLCTACLDGNYPIEPSKEFALKRKEERVKLEVSQ